MFVYSFVALEVKGKAPYLKGLQVAVAAVLSF